MIATTLLKRYLVNHDGILATQFAGKKKLEPWEFPNLFVFVTCLTVRLTCTTLKEGCGPVAQMCLDLALPPQSSFPLSFSLISLDLFLLLQSSPTYINAHNLTFQHKIIKINNSILPANMSVVVEGSVSEALDTTTIWKALQDLPKAAREEVEDKNVSQWIKTCYEHLCDVSTSDMILLCQISTSALRLDTIGASWTRLWWQMTAVSCAKISSRLSGRTLGNGLRKPYG